MKNFFGAVLTCLSFVSGDNEVAQEDFKRDQNTLVLDDQNAAWDHYKLSNMKTYSSPDEEDYRKLVHQENRRMIVEWNERFKRGEVTFMMGENEYSDLTDEEYSRMKNLRLPRQIIHEATQESPFRFHTSKPNEWAKEYESSTLRSLPVNCTLDLRTDPCLVSIKDQKRCGSCYAFPATCLVEFAFCKNKNLKKGISFSEQQCVDCTRQYGNFGCGGGYYENCFKYWKVHKIASSTTYPYTAKAARCKSVALPFYSNVGAYTTLVRWDEVMIETVFCTFKQPIAVAIHATKLFNAYKSGVFTDPTCANYLAKNDTTINHAVTIVGVGTDSNGTKYWTLRNSWGKTWGENGYMKIKRDDNTCNLALDPCMVHL